MVFFAYGSNSSQPEEWALLIRCISLWALRVDKGTQYFYPEDETQERLLLQVWEEETGQLDFMAFDQEQEVGAIKELLLWKSSQMTQICCSLAPEFEM